MKKLFVSLCSLMFAFALSAQVNQYSGVVVDDTGMPLPGSAVVVKGTSTAMSTDSDGKFSIEAQSTDTLVVSFMGFDDYVLALSTLAVGADLRLELKPTSGQELDEVVVTALGIKREKKALGYAVQEVGGAELAQVKSDNVVNNLSGRTAGVQIRRTTNMGGSTNVVIRGSTSLAGNNQALFVIDGVPISNINTNSVNQANGRSGYDYGNAASDINPDDIESVSILKGAAASALYGSRAANGVVMITTKKGKADGGKKISVTLNSSISIGQIDEKTFVKYQKTYGAGFGKTKLNEVDVDGDGKKDLATYFRDDAAVGPKYSDYANQKVYTWESLYPEYYKQAYGNERPKFAYKYADNDALSFFETAISLTNSVALAGGDESGSYRLSYTNFDYQGVLPNSKMRRNTVNFSASRLFTEDFTASTSVNYVKTYTKGRNQTGYGNAITGMFRQWYDPSVDIKKQKNAYDLTGKNITWNPKSPTDLAPLYFDNPYWDRNENYQDDERNRVYGNVSLNYDILKDENNKPVLSLMGRVGMDTYSFVQEERLRASTNPRRFGVSRATVGSGYSRKEISATELNYDAFLTYDNTIVNTESNKVTLNSVLGANIRRNYYRDIFASTETGLAVDGIYSLGNSVGKLPNPEERDEVVGLNGIFLTSSIGYNDILFVDASIRRDHASTLPSDNNVFYYPSVSTSFIFDDLLKQDWISFAKLRLNYAQVGKAPTFAVLQDVYTQNTPFGTKGSSSLPATKRNPNLKPEITTSIEAGLEFKFLKGRIGFDAAVYSTSSKDQIMPVEVTKATGFNKKYENAGELQNKGIELSFNADILKTDDFSWNMNVNWSKNRSEVVKLFGDVKNLQLGSLQGGVTINATVGEPYGTIKGNGFKKNKEGQIIISSKTGKPLRESNKIIGNAQVDWVGGLTNTVSYKGLTLSFLIDVSWGGDIFSLDQYYGQQTNLYDEIHAKGIGYTIDNKKETIVYQGVTEDGKKNTKALDIRKWGNRPGYSSLNPEAFVFDATSVRLREISLSYQLPLAMLGLDSIFSNVSAGVNVSNAFIFYKDLPDADPESGLGSGNIQGYSTGSMPTVREYGFNLKLQF